MKNKIIQVLMISVVFVMLVGYARAETTHYLVLDDNSPVSDVSIGVDLQERFENFKSNENSEVTKNELDKRVTVFIYEGEAIIIIGETSPIEHVRLATEIKEYFIKEKGIQTKMIVSNEVLYDDLVKLMEKENRCLDPEACKNPVCTDSDGFDYFTKGTTKLMYGDGTTSEREDYCDGNTVVENYCNHNGMMAQIKYACKINCINGACAYEENINATQAPVCTDSDGFDYFTKGTTKLTYLDGTTSASTDECRDDVLIENYCRGNMKYRISYVCEHGCQDGACLPEGSDNVQITLKREYRTQEKIEVIAVNKGDKDVTYWVLNCRNSFGIEMLTADGYRNPVSLENLDECMVVCTTGISFKKILKPGERIGLGTWDQVLGLKDCDNRDSKVYARPGTYRISFNYFDVEDTENTIHQRFRIVNQSEKDNVKLILDREYEYGEEIVVQIANLGFEKIQYGGSCGPFFSIIDLSDNNEINLKHPCIDCVDVFDPDYIMPSKTQIIGTWNQGEYPSESECGRNTEVATSQVKPGLYQIKFSYWNSQNKKQTITSNFRIKKKEKEDEKQENCNGCEVDGLCLPYGTRFVDDTKTPLYCNIDGTISSQLPQEEQCQNNYECLSNTCASGSCTDLAGEIRETRSLLRKIMDWLNRIFG